MPPCVVKGFRHRRNQLRYYIEGFTICQGKSYVFFKEFLAILTSEVNTMAFWKRMTIFGAGGAAYVGLELLWRGRSHISMFLAGGTCLMLIGHLNEVKPRLPFGLRMLTGAGIITMTELAVGLLANRDHRVWDYRGQWGNFLGQICPLFCLVWIPMAGLALLVYEGMKRMLSVKSGARR